MRILVTCDPEIPVPPIKYGGVERLVSGLCIEYSKMGHEVFLVANKQSTEPSAREIFGWNSSHSRGVKNILSNAMQLRKIVRSIKPDVIHSFSRLLYLYPLFLAGNKIPILQTYGRAISQKSTSLAKRLGGKYLHFACCGKHMIKNFKDISDWHIVYNFINTDFFTYNPSIKKEDYLLFLGRICHQKGTRQAIEAALNANHDIIIAGLKESPYFEENIEPFLKNPHVKYIGLVDDKQKLPLLQKAKGLLFPINGPEAFGIVLAESFACGTPVIAFNKYSVPEIVKENVNGYIVNDVSEMSNRIYDLSSLNPLVIENDAVENYSSKIIANNYLFIFNRMRQLV